MYLIKRTTTSLGKDNIYYFMQLTPMGPMFQPKNLARRFESAETARKFMEENLSKLEGVMEIVADDF